MVSSSANLSEQKKVLHEKKAQSPLDFFSAQQGLHFIVLTSCEKGTSNARRGNVQLEKWLGGSGAWDYLEFLLTNEFTVIPLVSSNPNSDGALLDPGFPLSSSVDTLCTSVFLLCSK